MVINGTLSVFYLPVISFLLTHYLDVHSHVPLTTKKENQILKTEDWEGNGNCRLLKYDWMAVIIKLSTMLYAVKASSMAAKSIDLGVKVRCLQQKCKLSTMQTTCVVELLAEHVARPNLRLADREMKQAAGVEKMALHGCVSCNKYVFEPKDRNVICPKCGYSHYKQGSRVANETVFYFSLRPRLEALLRLPNFVKLLKVYLFKLLSCLLR